MRSRRMSVGGAQPRSFKGLTAEMSLPIEVHRRPSGHCRATKHPFNPASKNRARLSVSKYRTGFGGRSVQFCTLFRDFFNPYLGGNLPDPEQRELRPNCCRLRAVAASRGEPWVRRTPGSISPDKVSLFPLSGIAQTLARLTLNVRTTLCASGARKAGDAALE